MSISSRSNKDGIQLIAVARVTLRANIHRLVGGAGVTIEPSVSLTALENTEVLLIDLGPTPRSLVDKGR